MRTMSLFRLGGVLLLGLVLMVMAAPAAGARHDDEQPAPVPVVSDAAAEVAEPFDGRATEDTIDRVRFTLVGIAIGTGVGLVGYWWHTNPARRLRVATRRAGDLTLRRDESAGRTD